MKKLEGNGYYKIDEKEIIEYDIEYVNDERVENLEYKDGNVLVYSINRREDNDYGDLINMMSSVRIIVSDYITMTMIYREIPSNIERIIVDKKEYKNERYELMEFMEEKEIIEYVMEIENKYNDSDIYNDNNENGKNILYYVCNIGREELCIKIAGKMRRESIERIYDNNNTILHIASYYRMERLIKYLVGRLSSEYINKKNKKDETILDLSKRYKLGNINMIMKYINRKD